MKDNEEVLNCVNDSRSSFYGKAVLIRNGLILELKSYNTIVAKYDGNTNKMDVYGWYSMTTARHINEFLYYCGFDTVTKKQMINWNKEV